MSTICKLNPMVREQRRRRADLLRQGWRDRRTPQETIVLNKLETVRRAPYLTGEQKHLIFHYGAKTLAALRGLL
ncbi:MAG: hypothetical protein ACLPOA_18825 [Methylocella sp.]